MLAKHCGELSTLLGEVLVFYLQPRRPNGTSVLGQIRRLGSSSAKAPRRGGWSRTKCIFDAERENLPR